MEAKKDFHIPVELQQLVSAEQAYGYRIVPIGNPNGHIEFLTDHENMTSLRKELQVVLNKEVLLKQEQTKVIDTFLSHNFRKSKTERTSTLSYSEDFLENILRFAKEIGSSDIHFEPYEERCRIRFRLDGKLKEQYSIPLEDYPVIVNKLKIRAQLDISEKRLPQDGRITISSESDEFDIRVSSLPTLHGEKIVLRILSRNADTIALEHLGFSEEELKTYKECMRKPNGIVLISGPTGSGKTTTLYATLKLLNDPDTNILTIEDPIEYTLEGINQVQLRESIGLDFASAMRTFLRQDPDVIMVGEVRDTKTANMAIRAALTGHLVLSTIHTNSAWATISRLVDMDIPSFLIASTLNMSVAQRLVRLLCKDCKQEVSIGDVKFPEGFQPPEKLDKVYKAVGCTKCYHTGYEGRKAIYEIIPIDKELIQLIRDNKLDISEHLKEKNIKTLQENALRMVMQGDTSVEEVYALLT